MHYASDISPAETECGFDVREHASGIRVVMRELRGGLQAIKAQADDGTTVYEICDERLTPLYAPATSLDELVRRFAP